jgi:hypothetical protein
VGVSREACRSGTIVAHLSPSRVHGSLLEQCVCFYVLRYDSCTVQSLFLVSCFSFLGLSNSVDRCQSKCVPTSQERNNAVYTPRKDAEGNNCTSNEQFTMCAGNPLCEGFPALLPEEWLRTWRYPHQHEDLSVCGKKDKVKAKDFLIKRFDDLQSQVFDSSTCG